MLNTATTVVERRLPMPPSLREAEGAAHREAARAIGAALELLRSHLEPQRRLLHAGDRIYQAGERFQMLHILHAGFVKIVNLSADGREQVAGLKFRGDWLGFDGIAEGQYTCDAVAMDTTEVWSFRYDALIAACARVPALLRVLHEAMSREIARDRDSMMSLCTLPADARVMRSVIWSERRPLLASELAHERRNSATRASAGSVQTDISESRSRPISRLIAMCSADSSAGQATLAASSSS